MGETVRRERSPISWTYEGADSADESGSVRLEHSFRTEVLPGWSTPRSPRDRNVRTPVQASGLSERGFYKSPEWNLQYFTGRGIGALPTSMMPNSDYVIQTARSYHGPGTPCLSRAYLRHRTEDGDTHACQVTIPAGSATKVEPVPRSLVDDAVVRRENLLQRIVSERASVRAQVH